MHLTDLAISPHLPARSRRRLLGVIDARAWSELDAVDQQDLQGLGFIPGISGGAPGDDDDGGSDDDSDSDDDADPADDADDDTEDKPKRRGRKADKPKDDDDDDADTASSGAVKRLERRLGEAERRARTAERKLAEKARKDDEDAGEFERLYNEERSSHEETKKSVRKANLNRTISEVARDAKFRNPDIVHSLITLDEDVDPEDDKREIERAVKALAKREPYLVRKEDAQHEDAGRGDDDGRTARQRRRGQDTDADTDTGDTTDVRGPARLRRAYAESGAGASDT